MYENTLGANLPNETIEIPAVQDAYYPVISELSPTNEQYYMHDSETNVLIRYYEFPSYALYHPDMGDQSGAVEEMPVGEPLHGAVTTIVHYYFSDGSTMSEIIDQAEF